MCGVFGLVYPEVVKYDQQKFIEQATFVGTLRGVDSTGMAFVDKDNEVEIYKRALAGPDFTSSSVGQRAMSALRESFITIGHNRAATRGVVKDYTAHPFTFGTITGCHNGTLEHSSGLDIKKHPVDSMNLLDALSQIGDSPDAGQIAAFLGGVRGSFALTWYDAATEMMWFARNPQRPLAYFEDDKGLYWASEMGMLGWLGFRNKLLTKNDMLKSLDANTVVGYNTRQMRFEDEATFTAPKPVTYSGGGGGVYNRQPDKRVFFHCDDVQQRVARVMLDEAIKEKLWNEADKEVYAVFYPKEDQPKSPKGQDELRGIAYLSQGEKVPFTCWSRAGTVDIDRVYMAGVSSIMLSEKDSTIIPRITLMSTSLEPVDDDPLELATQLDEEAYFDLSMSGGGIYTFQDKKGDGDQGETTGKGTEAPKKNLPVKVTPITDAKVKKVEEEKEDSNLFRGPLNNLIAGELFDRLTDGGCHHCNGVITREDAPTMGWLFANSGSLPICPECIDHVEKLHEAYGLKEGTLVTQ